MGEDRPAPARHDRFSRWASTYETGGLSLLLGSLQRQALAALRPTEGDRLLDVGCGTGVAIRNVTRTVDVAVGIDLSPAMIGRARDLATAEPGARFVVADAHNLPFTDGAFTAKLCTTALRHFTDPTAALQEMVRVLCPGGRLVLADLLTETTCPRTVGALRRRQPYAGASAALRSAGLRLAHPIVVTTAFGPYVISLATNPVSAAAAPRRGQPGAVDRHNVPRRVRCWEMRLGRFSSSTLWSA